MKKQFVALVVVSLAACVVSGQSNYSFTDVVQGTPVYFTNSMGSASQEGSLVVFEGVLESSVVVNKALDPASGYDLASIRMAVVVRLFDELPEAGDVGAVQGALAALRTGTSESGTYHVWADTGSGMDWVQLLNDADQPLVVEEGSTNKLLFVFHYPADSSPVRYKLMIGDIDTEVLQASKWYDSNTEESGGIKGAELLGNGGLMEVGTAGGSVTPLSSGVHFRVYSTAAGIIIEIDTMNEEGSGVIQVFAWIDGEWVPIGEFVAQALVFVAIFRFGLRRAGVEMLLAHAPQFGFFAVNFRIAQ